MIPLPAARSTPRPATVLLAVIVAATALGAPLAVAQTGSPGEPIAFHGAAVDGAGDAAPVGTAIVAAVDGAEVDRVTVAAAGVYAGDGPTDGKLRTTTAAGATVTFHVGGVGGPTAAQTHDVEGPGVFELDLVFPAGTFAAEDESPGAGGGSGGGSGGGGGGGGSTPATESPGEDVAAAATFDADGRASATVEGLAGGDTASIDLGDGIGAGDADASITRVDVTVGDGEGDDGRSITFEGASLPGPPSEGAAFRTGDAGDDALSYFELSVTAGDDAEPVESATVTFTVDAAGLDERGLDPGDVALHRYDEETGSWQELTTELVGEADGELVYEATTPGFSLFAVGPRARQTTPDGGTATPDPRTSTPAATPDDGAPASEEDATPDADATHGPDTEAGAADDGQGLLSRVVPAVLLVAGVVVVVLGLLFVRRR